MKRILLVEPDFPIANKSKNHKNFLPIGMLKIAAYLRQENEIRLVRGVPRTIELSSDLIEFNPDEIWITSLFTYWSRYVRTAVRQYKKMFPSAKVLVGGIYASLRPKNEVLEYTGADEVYQGIIPEAEKVFPAYDLVTRNGGNSVPLDYQIVHSSRGCPRKCKFCGTWKIEPEFVPDRSIKDRIAYQKIVFYDNNFLMNPYVENILMELAELRKERKLKWCESQSGFDGRVIIERPHLAIMIREAGFRYPRIAWDWKFSDCRNIQRQIDLLVGAGYSSRDIFVFVLYNWDIPFDEMERKRVKCWEWKVQISDCRYRPLNQLFDDYDPKKPGQTNEDYHIHGKAGWTDELVKAFRKNVRRQNICVRERLQFYSKTMERKDLPRSEIAKLRKMSFEEANRLLPDIWNPALSTDTGFERVSAQRKEQL